MKAVIFDVDGVLLKTHNIDGTYLWSSSIKNDLGLSKLHFNKIFSSSWENVVKGKIDTIEYLSNVFQDHVFTNLDITPEIYINYWLSKDNHVKLEVLEFIKSIKTACYIGTNQESFRTNHILKHIGSYFQGYFSSYKIGYIKPEPKFLKHIEKTLSLKPSDLLIIDDTIENIQSAQNGGWNTYHYRDNLDHLKSFLAKL